MRKILKNYTKNFIKNWAETFGFLIFIILLFSSLFGVVSSPMQLFIKETKIKLNSKNPDYTVNLNSSNRGKYILINYLYWGDHSIFGSDFTGDYNNLFFSDEFYRAIFINSYIAYNNFSDYKTKSSDNYNEVKKLITYYDEEYDKYKTPIILNDDNIYDLTTWNNDDENTMTFDTKLSGSDTDTFYTCIESYINKLIKNGSRYENNMDIYSPEIIDYTIQLDNMKESECLASNSPILDIFRKDKYFYNFDAYFISKIINNYQKNNSIDNFNINYELSWSYNSKSLISSSKNLNLKVISEDQDSNSIFYSEKNNRYDTDQVVISKGRQAKYSQKEQEIVLSESFAKKNNIKIGDTFIMNYGSWNDSNFKVVGFGDKYDYLSPTNYNPFSEDSSSSGYVYLPTKLMEDIYNTQNKGDNLKKNISSLSLKVQIKQNNNANIQNLFTYNDIYYFGSSEDYQNINSWTDPLTDYTQTSNYETIQNQNIQIIIYFILIAGIIALSVLFINFIIKKELNQTRKQIGIFKSLGYKTSELSWIFTIKEYINMLIGTMIGWLLSFPLQQFVAKSWQKQTALYIQPICTEYIYLIICLLIIPILIAAISFIFNFIYLKENIISLINNSKKIKNIRKTKNKIAVKSNMKIFSLKLMRSFTKQSLSKFIIVNILLFFISLTTFLELTSLNLIKQTINSSYLQYNDDYQTSFHTIGKSIVPVKVNDDGKLYTQISDKSQTEFIDYSKYSSKTNDAISSYINENSSSSKIFANNLKNIIHVISTETKDNPSCLYTPSNIQSIIGGVNSELKPAIIILLFSDYCNPNIDYNSMTYAELYSYAYNKAVNTISQLISGEDINIEKTLFSICPLDSDGKYSFIYLKDVARIMSILVNSSNISSYISKNNIDTSDGSMIHMIINNNFSNKIDIDSQKEWSKYIQLSDSQTSSSSLSNKLGGTLSSTISLSSTLTSLLFAACSVSTNQNYNPLINFNQVYFDSTKETMNYTLSIDSKLFPKKSTLNLCDFRSLYATDEFNLGDPNNIYNLKNITINQEKKLSKINSDGSINILMSKVSAKYNNYVIGDEFTVPLAKGIEIKMKVVGIIDSMTFIHQIFADYKTFFYNYSDNILNYDSSKDYYSIYNDIKTYDSSFTNIPISNLFSQNKLYTGNVDYNNLAKSIRNLKFVYPSVTLNVKPNSSVLLSLFDSQLEKISGYSELIKKINADIDSSPTLTTNPNILSSSDIKLTSTSYKTSCIELQKKIVNELSKKVTIIIYLFICLSFILITIILLLVVNIIIDESMQIILTLRSIGYNKKEINLIILGGYIISGLIIFIISWLANMIVWSIVLKIIWTKSQVLLSNPINYNSIIINFSIILAILILGYISCAFKNSKLKVTDIIE